MDDNNSRDDRGLKVLLDMWNNDDPRWFSTNEFDDLLANLHALDAMLEASARKPVLWKWVIIATHTTLQSLAVCKADWKRRPLIAREDVTPILESIISNLRKIV